MNIYDVLRRLIALSSMSEVERKDATEAVNELERMNGLGTTAGILKTLGHECQWQYNYLNPRGRCAICGRFKDSE